MFVEQLSQSLALFGLGMGTVFSLLSLLIACVVLLSVVSRRFGRDESDVSENTKASEIMQDQGETIESPLSANIIEVCVRQGEFIEEGDVVMRLEAMKMETEVLASGSGRISKLHVKEGDSVDSGQIILSFQGTNEEVSDLLEKNKTSKPIQKQGAIIKSPLSANIIEMCVGMGDSVEEGDIVMRLEAMKMETDVLANGSGEVSQLFAKEGDSVDSGQVVLALV
jgi:biotin carboxyl carrier protein